MYSVIMSTLLKEGKVGKFSIVKTKIPKGHTLRMYDYEKGRHYYIETANEMPIILLKEEGDIWMTDDPSEQDGIQPALDVAKGDCLMCGLGIGLLPIYLAYKRPQKLRRANPITSFDIVELNEDVIKLVHPQIVRALLFPINVIHGDALEYLKTTEKRYDFIHIDIWGSITATIQEIDKATALAQRCLKPDGNIRVWLKELYDNIKDRIPKTPTTSTGVGFHEPCLICGKKLRSDYAGLCMDCSDSMGLSEVFLKSPTPQTPEQILTKQMWEKIVNSKRDGTS